MYEPFVYALLFFGGVAVWLPIYYYMVSKWVGDHVVTRCETGEIDLNYLLDQGGVFDEFMLAEMGQLSRSASAPGAEGEDIDPISMGIEASGSILKAIGLKKPPAILQYKLAQVLGTMLDQQANAGTNDGFDIPEFGP